MKDLTPSHKQLLSLWRLNSVTCFAVVANLVLFSYQHNNMLLLLYLNQASNHYLTSMAHGIFPGLYSIFLTFPFTFCFFSLLLLMGNWILGLLLNVSTKRQISQPASQDQFVSLLPVTQKTNKKTKQTHKQGTEEKDKFHKQKTNC